MDSSEAWGQRRQRRQGGDKVPQRGDEGPPGGAAEAAAGGGDADQHLGRYILANYMPEKMCRHFGPETIAYHPVEIPDYHRRINLIVLGVLLADVLSQELEIFEQPVPASVPDRLRRAHENGLITRHQQKLLATCNRLGNAAKHDDRAWREDILGCGSRASREGWGGTRSWRHGGDEVPRGTGAAASADGGDDVPRVDRYILADYMPENIARHFGPESIAQHPVRIPDYHRRITLIVLGVLLADVLSQELQIFGPVPDGVPDRLARSLEKGLITSREIMSQDFQNEVEHVAGVQK